MIYPPIEDAWILTGPTASGKSVVGIELAKQLEAEIISMDSMAVYRGMDIGTAKPSQEEQRSVRHHLIDVVDPDAQYSIAEYLRAVHDCGNCIRQRNRKVLFVGGTPLYLKALLCGFDDGPQADWQFRDELEIEAKRAGTETLYCRLTSCDPEAAERVHPNDRRRIIRALEYFEKTGNPISSVQTHFASGELPSGVRIVALDWPRAVLHRRINERVQNMYRGGLVEEVRAILDRFGTLGRTASQAVGYRDVLAMLRGELSASEAISRTQAGTRQLARRQLIWLRGLPTCHRLALANPFETSTVARQVLQQFSGDLAP